VSAVDLFVFQDLDTLWASEGNIGLMVNVTTADALSQTDYALRTYSFHGSKFPKLGLAPLVEFDFYGLADPALSPTTPAPTATGDPNDYLRFARLHLRLTSGSPGFPAGLESTSLTGNATFSRSFTGFSNQPPGTSGTVQAFLGGDRCTGGTQSPDTGEHYSTLLQCSLLLLFQLD
jgi:hypothetical protein